MPFTFGGQNGTFLPSCHCTAMPVVLPTAPDRVVALVELDDRAGADVARSSRGTATSLSASVVPAFSIASLRSMIAS